MKRGLIGGGLLAGLGAVILVGVLVSNSTSPRSWIAGKYTKVNATTFRAAAPPAKVAGEIARKFKPSDRVYVPAGAFLRYPKVMIAVLPDGRGSRISIETPDRGYRNHHSAVSGRWGGPGGRASLFRGGGPGEGK
ncbi:DUF4247 domain-containing protein [Actinomadura craniellae]|uniref:DUF4247 domain-containing protein n=1 Tax=Actinomadura craniellae TaxID=2231787 RepID=A0A365H5S9_9ACTN|nr:DUF4247 domain-containing protein [Actinomadura craniellae]RAY14464.1 DUF4247 domain-containing protein [Actinomadura craniellae]